MKELIKQIACSHQAATGRSYKKTKINDSSTYNNKVFKHNPSSRFICEIRMKSIKNLELT